jgi:hypothetical protein
VALFRFSLAEMNGIDLQAEVEAKIAKNALRTYSRLPDGTLAKDGVLPVAAVIPGRPRVTGAC